MASICGQNRQSENGAVFGRGTSLSLSLSLVARTFWHAFALNLKGFFTHFIVVSSHLIVNFSYFIVVLTHLFTYKRHFLGHFVFLKFLNALFVRFLRLSLRAVFAKTAWQSINLALFLLFGLPRSLCSLAMTADFVILSLCKKAKNPYKLKEKLPILGYFSNTQYGKSGFRLKMTSKENTLCYFEMMTNRNAKTMLNLWIATLVLFARNDGYFHLNCFQKFKQSQHKG